MTDRLNELNDKIIENLEKQVSNYEKVIEFDNTTISNLSNALKKIKEVLIENTPNGDTFLEETIHFITQALEKESK